MDRCFCGISHSKLITFSLVREATQTHAKMQGITIFVKNMYGNRLLVLTTTAFSLSFVCMFIRYWKFISSQIFAWIYLEYRDICRSKRTQWHYRTCSKIYKCQFIKVLLMFSVRRGIFEINKNTVGRNKVEIQIFLFLILIINNIY